jgi:hypothetical protein
MVEDYDMSLVMGIASAYEASVATVNTQVIDLSQFSVPPYPDAYSWVSVFRANNDRLPDWCVRIPVKREW